jgi:hypothetical protein
MCNIRIYGSITSNVSPPVSMADVSVALVVREIM